jgi:hypothetical protein
MLIYQKNRLLQQGRGMNKKNPAFGRVFNSSIEKGYQNQKVTTSQ